MATLSGGEVFDATRQGAKEAILAAMYSITAAPGTDTFDTIKDAVKEAAKEWFESNKAEIIKAIAQGAK